ncbi:3-methyl-2-oxobutanoate hydroxymethyltransferase [Streptomyces sp. NPDC056656]|uniref:3-methyl-2-oxobutanoate hydroxymethyltransferase n=1 Tax=Streptomyces sp. NPDC056656 TaxID=3345895 RepID=UPI0036BBE63D
MSTYKNPVESTSDRKPVTVTDVADMYRRGNSIVMITAYDYPSAQVADSAGVDVVLAGDSGAMTVLGYPSTVEVSVEEMLMLTAAVRRGLKTALLVGDLPFGSYEVSDAQAITTAQRFVKQGGATAVKLEGGGRQAVSRVRAIVESGIPVMGHIGLTPQKVNVLGGFKTQGRTAARAAALREEALALQEAGCFAIVFEAVPTEVTEIIVPELNVPVIGIGAGPSTAGQVLVLHDLLGLFDGFTPKFAKRYADLRKNMVEAVEEYAAQVRNNSFPGPEHCYHIDAKQLAVFSGQKAPTEAGTTPSPAQ